MKKNGLLFFLGGCLYPTLEMVWRGYTHPSMALAGGLCLCLIDCVCVGVLEGRRLWVRCLAGATLITGVELAAGLILNNVMGLSVWDYSSLPMNFLGQVCLPYSVLWFWLTIPAMSLCRLCRKTLETGSLLRLGHVRTMAADNLPRFDIPRQ